MDFHSAMETFAEAWMAANTKLRPENSESQLQRDSKNDTNSKPEEALRSRGEQGAVTANGQTSSRQTSPERMQSEDSGKPNNEIESSKSLTVHIVIECIQLSQPRINDNDFQGTIEIDSFVVLPPFARFSDILHIVLSKTGYIDDLPYARGYLQLRNWKPVPLEQVAENDNKSIHDVLSQIAPITTLYIRLYSSAKLRCSRDIKDRLLRLLISHSQPILTSVGCPLDEGHLFTLIRGNGEISEDSIRLFESWWSLQSPRTPLPFSHHPTQMNSSFFQTTSSCSPEKTPTESVHPVMQQNLSSYLGLEKTRMRTSFDPEYELPRLHRWFSENQHPTRIQIQQYVSELNSLESRRGKKALDVNNVVYWFKNARAAFKRQEYRSMNGNKSLFHDEASVSDCDEHNDIFANAMAKQLTNRSPIIHGVQIHQPIKSLDSTPEDTQKTMKEEDNIAENISNSSEPTPKFGLHSNPPKSSPPGSIEPVESEVEMSDDDDCRSRESGTIDPNKDRPSPGLTPNAISLPPYPSMPSLGQAGHMDRLPYAVMPSPLFQHSMMYMAQYMPQVSPFSSGLHGGGLPEERRKRNRTFIDPVSEVPRLEQWFTLNTHPSHNLILKYTEELNRMHYRQKFPKLEPKNIQFWFKNRRAKCKRLRVSI